MFTRSMSWAGKLCLSLLLIILVFHHQPKAWALEATLFEMNDPRGDENGPGTYKYPTGTVFDPFKKGLFDLEKFKVTVDERYYFFDLTMVSVTNPWGAPEGFSHPIFNIYIDSIPNQGRTETFREGAFVDFNAQHGWEYFIKVVGWRNTALFTYKDPTTSNGQKKNIDTKLQKDGKTIRVRVPRSYLDNPENWSYYVLVGSQDGLGPDNFRVVMEKRSQWQFGGGTDTNYDPNVIDLLAPEKGEKSQKVMLGSYNLAKGRLAEISPIIPDHQEAASAMDNLGKTAQLKAELADLVAPITNKFPLEKYYPVYIAAGVVVIIILLLGWVNFGKYFKEKEDKDAPG